MNYPVTFTNIVTESDDFELDANGWLVCKKDGTVLCSAEMGVGGTYTTASYVAGYMLIKTPDGNTRTTYIGSSYKLGWNSAIGYMTRAIPVNVSAGTKLALAGYGAANSSTLGTYISLYTVYL